MKWAAIEERDQRGEVVCITLCAADKFIGIGPGNIVSVLYEIEAETWEQACQEHHRRQGWEPYRPMDTPTPGPPLVRRRRSGPGRSA